MQLKDKGLFREQCYVNGEWVDADSGVTFDVNNPCQQSKVGVRA